MFSILRAGRWSRYVQAGTKTIHSSKERIASWNRTRLCAKPSAKKGCKNVAQELNRSLTIVHKWTEPTRNGHSGLPNPLDRIHELLVAADHLEPLHWLCARCDGYFVPNPKPSPNGADDLLHAEAAAVAELADQLKAIAEAVRDRRVTPAEAAALREQWERVKPLMEGFVRDCEQGRFGTNL